MIKALPLAVAVSLVLITNSCKKENRIVITGTVKIRSGCYTHSWLVAIDQPDSSGHSFICTRTPPVGTYYNCSNAVYITNMPQEFAAEGKRLKFSKWKDNGIMCLSSSYAPHHLDVTDLSQN
jgi:hypothetical protein